MTWSQQWWQAQGQRRHTSGTQVTWSAYIVPLFVSGLCIWRTSDMLGHTLFPYLSGFLHLVKLCMPVPVGMAVNIGPLRLYPANIRASVVASSVVWVDNHSVLVRVVMFGHGGCIPLVLDYASLYAHPLSCTVLQLVESD